MVPKTGPRSGSEILLLFNTLEQGQTSQKWTPFWELFEDQFCTKYEKMRKWRIPKNRCRKKVTLRKFGCLSEHPEAPWQTPRAPGTRNNLSNNSNNNSNSCSSCGSMFIFSARYRFFLINVDFCFPNCPVLDETCKKRMLLIVRIHRLVIWHALGQGPANFPRDILRHLSRKWRIVQFAAVPSISWCWSGQSVSMLHIIKSTVRAKMAFRLLLSDTSAINHVQVWCQIQLCLQHK